MISTEQDQIIRISSKKRSSNNVTPPSQQLRNKRINQKQKTDNVVNSTKIDNDENSNNYLKPLSNDFYINITTDGLRHMDYICHLNDDQVESKTLERQLRPISGLRNRLKRNSHKYNEALIEETDLVKRISKIQTIKRLDMSYNDLNYYPKPLCDLIQLETLNLSNNKLQDTELPIDFENYQNLIEIILDSNQFKTIPKSLSKFKKLTRLSIRNNLINDLRNIEGLRKMRYLVADNNVITSLDEAFLNLDKLELLHLKGNSINYIQTNILKSNFNQLKQLDLSYNKLQFIPSDLFMLPRLEILNLSNNLLNKLPILPVTFKRAMTMYLIDLSSNYLVKFYEYLLSLATFIDLSGNKLKSLPSNAIQALNIDNLKHKTIKLDGNPLEYPPIDVCVNGLDVIKQFFDEAASHIQINHGFKITLIGDVGCGKTSLAYALEDFHAQSNLVEKVNPKLTQLNDIGLDIPLDTQALAKFIEVHEFLFKMDTNKMNHIIQASSNGKFFEENKSDKNSVDLVEPVTTMPMSIFDMNGSISQFGHLIPFFIDKASLIILCIDITTFDDKLSDDISVAEENLKYWLDIILFKMSKITNFYLLPVATKCDLYINTPRKSLSSVKSSPKDSLVLNKLDNTPKWYENSDLFSKTTRTKLKLITTNILNKIHQHFEMRLSFVKNELEKIEKMTKISPSQSDRLKTLAALLNNCKPGIHEEMPVISSSTMHGINSLNEVIKSIVCNNESFFPNVNKKVPTLWLEAEKYVFSRFNRIPMTRFANDSVRFSPHTLTSISSLCTDFEEYKGRITEKYGMEHMIFEITNYLCSEGKLLWLQDSDAWCTKVFFKPNMLFDIIHALYREDFNENFTDNHLQVIRTKLGINEKMSDEFIEHLKTELLSKGCAYLDLLKLIWLPIMLSDSDELLNDLVVLLMVFFHIGYPQVPKSKIKKVFQNFSSLLDTSGFKSRSLNRNYSSSAYLANRKLNAYSARNETSSQFLRTQSRMSNYEEQYTARSNNTITAYLDTETQVNNEIVKFDCIMVPYYMPFIKNEEKLNDIRNNLRTSAATAAAAVFNNSNSKDEKFILPRVGLKYSFPWGLIPGVFERFTVNCMINTDLYYKMHWKDAVYAYNESNTIGVLMHLKKSDENEIKYEIIFEFYVVQFNLSDSGELDTSTDMDKKSIQLDFENLWSLVMRIVMLFEDMLSNLPSMIYKRYSQCPECNLFTFLGEWMTPKELQGLKLKKCSNCDKDIDALYLVKPNTGRNLAIELKRLKQRLENIIQMRTESATLTRSADESPVNDSRTNSPTKLLSPTQLMKNAINKTNNKSIKLVLNT